MSASAAAGRRRRRVRPARGRRNGGFGSARVAIAVLCSFLQGGCLTGLVLDKYEEGRPLEAARLEVLEASSSLIRLSWELSYKGSHVRSGVMSFDPLLANCEQVNVFLRGAREVLQVEPGELHTVHPVESPFPAPRPPGPCDVVILARMMSNVDLAL